MKSPKVPDPPPVADPVPVPQPDDPALEGVKRDVRISAENRRGSRASLLTPGGSSGVSSSQNRSKRLGYGSIAAG